MGLADHSCPHIAIVGGGMVGISLAIMLADQASPAAPFKITLIEKFAFPELKKDRSKNDGSHRNELDNSQSWQPSFDARSTALSAGSVKLLQQSGCWKTLQQHAEPIRDIHISDRGHYGNTLLHAEDYQLPALGYVVENRWLGECLLERLYELQQVVDINCLAPATVEHCKLTAEKAVLSVRQNDALQSIAADVVLIADGAESSLRQSLGIDTRTTAYQQSAIITNIALQNSHQGVAYERFTEQGPLAVLPLETCDGIHRASVVWTRNSNASSELMALGDSEFLTQLQQCFGFRAGVLTQVGQRHCYPLELVESVEQVRSRIVVAGNAAHFLHPVAGQGFNLSLRDCAVLAKVLVTASRSQQDVGSYRTLSAYEQQRERDQQVTIGLTHTMVKMFSSQRLPPSIMRQMGLLSLHVLPALKHSLAKHMMGVT